MRQKHLILAAMVWVAACGGSQEPPPLPAAPPARPAQTTTARPANQDDAARRAREAEAAARARELEAQRRATLSQVVYFDYDRAEIRADSRGVLDQKARVMRDAPTVRIRIEGHADERGSTEYNLALGNRRAEAVRAYLTGVGVAASRIETLSYGEARPAQQGRSEAAWSRNRRAEFAVVAGVLSSE